MSGDQTMERRLAAILSADVKSYSRLMGEDEAATIQTLTAYREVLATLIPQHRGRVVDAVGDNLLAEFPSVVQAVECAVAIQRELSARNAALPLHRRMEFRIGINLGDVVVEGEHIYGDGVNIAARLESLAEAGGICLSGTVYEQVATRLALGYEDLGEQAVKNIARPVRVYRVRITAQLIDATTGYYRWAEHYDRELQDIFALQAEIAQKIVGTLAVQLTAGEQARLRRFTAETNAQAREMFEKAIALDPGFALAYALLSVTYERAWGLRWSQDPQTLERAYTLAQQAVALDDALPAAHIVLGNAYWQKKQPDQAIAEMERAIALDPNEASGYGNLAKILNSVGKPEEALRLLGQAMRLNPYDYEYLHHLGEAYLLTGRFEESIAALKRVVIRNPDFLPTRLVLAAIYMALGWDEEARVEAAEILRINPHFSPVARLAVPDPATPASAANAHTR
jgi:class 3 adenylate cyclase/Tfp pilus assembly protein PilF